MLDKKEVLISLQETKKRERREQIEVKGEIWVRGTT